MSQNDNRGLPIVGHPNTVFIYDISNGDFDPLNDSNIPGIPEWFRKQCSKGFFIRPITDAATIEYTPYGNYYNNPARVVTVTTIPSGVSVIKTEMSNVKWEETRIVKIHATGTTTPLTIEIGIL